MADIYIDPSVLAVRELYASLFRSEEPSLTINELLNKHAKAIHTAFINGDQAVTFHLGSWCVELIGKSSDHIKAATLSLAQVQESVAREYGFQDWQSVQNLGKLSLDSAFESTVELVITGNLHELRERLKLQPDLIKQRSHYGHAATLLHYLGANGVESHRQITPLNCVEVVQCLLDNGADVNAEANMYGGSTTLELVLTSAHPANAGVTQAVANLLRTAGGR